MNTLEKLKRDVKELIGVVDTYAKDARLMRDLLYYKGVLTEEDLKRMLEKRWNEIKPLPGLSGPPSKIPTASLDERF